MGNGPVKLFIRMFKAGETNELEYKKKTTGQTDKINNILKLQKQIRLKYKRKTKETNQQQRYKLTFVTERSWVCSERTHAYSMS